mgnify:CR=1 FL=1
MLNSDELSRYTRDKSTLGTLVTGCCMASWRFSLIIAAMALRLEKSEEWQEQQEEEGMVPFA